MYFNFPKEYLISIVKKKIDIYDYGFRNEYKDIEEFAEIYDEEYANKSVNE